VITWRSDPNGDDLLVRDGVTIACVKPSAELPGLWRVIRPKVVSGEHDRSVARSLALRLCRLSNHLITAGDTV
jgi:hypothetical protein